MSASPSGGDGGLLGDLVDERTAAEQVGVKLPTIQSMRFRGQIPFLRLGGGRLIRYSRRQLEEWLTSKQNVPSAKAKAVSK